MLVYQKKYPVYKKNYDKSYQHLFWDSQHINFIYCSTIVCMCYSYYRSVRLIINSCVTPSLIYSFTQ